MEKVLCKKCGWKGTKYELRCAIIYSHDGDISCLQCPKCKSIEYPHEELFIRNIEK